MAAKKIDLEVAAQHYAERWGAVRQCLERCDFGGAIKHAVASLPFIDEMMAYETKYQGTEFTSVETIDVVLRIAPPLFFVQAINELGDLLRAKKRIDRLASDDLAERLVHARHNMDAACHLWNALESHGTVDETSLIKSFRRSSTWQEISSVWHEAGVAEPVTLSGSRHWRLVTRMASLARVKCSGCGVKGKASKEKLLQTIRCPRCGVEGYFTLLSMIED